MELLRHINDRQIFYTHIPTDRKWFEELPTDNWIVFTIGDDKEIKFTDEIVSHSLDSNVCYTCSAGQLAGNTEFSFDLAIVDRVIATKGATEEPTEDDFEQSPPTTAHTNFSEGFWYAINLAHHPYKIVDKVVCADFTTKGVKQNLTELLDKFEKGWLPTDNEIEEPKYDN